MRFEFGDGGSKVLAGVKVHGRLLGASAPTVMFYNAQMGAAQATGGGHDGRYKNRDDRVYR